MSCVWMSGLRVSLLSACLVSTEARRGHLIPWSWSRNTVTSHCGLLGGEPRSFWGAAKANSPAVSPWYGLHYVHECIVCEHDEDQKTTFGVVFSFSMWVPETKASRQAQRQVPVLAEHLAGPLFLFLTQGDTHYIVHPGLELDPLLSVYKQLGLQAMSPGPVSSS